MRVTNLNLAKGEGEAGRATGCTRTVQRPLIGVLFQA